MVLGVVLDNHNTFCRILRSLATISVAAAHGHMETRSKVSLPSLWLKETSTHGRQNVEET